MAFYNNTPMFPRRQPMTLWEQQNPQGIPSPTSAPIDGAQQITQQQYRSMLPQTGVASPQQQIPRMPTPQIPNQRQSPVVVGQKPLAPGSEQSRKQVKPKPEVSPFMENMYKSIENVDPEERGQYLQTTMAKIKERLDRYEFRMARGIPLTPELQRQYNNLKSSFNDIQKYVNNPTVYDEYFKWVSRGSRPQENIYELDPSDPLAIYGAGNSL